LELELEFEDVVGSGAGGGACLGIFDAIVSKIKSDVLGSLKSAFLTPARLKSSFHAGGKLSIYKR
jgi:hypothetical protein